MPKKKIVFNLKNIEAMGALGCTYQEIADIHECSVRTVDERMSKDSAFSRAYKKGLGAIKMSLRRQQLKKAEAGDKTMMIWCGKNLLDQTDRIDNDSQDRFKKALKAVVRWPGEEPVKRQKKAKKTDKK